MNHEQTKVLDYQPNLPIDGQWGTGYFHQRARLFLTTVVNEQTIPVIFHTGAIILGRKGDGSPIDVDLTPFGGAEFGVSRRHARIDRQRDSLQITDLESANGTFLNNERLPAGISRILRNRSVLQLGRMVLRVRFL